MYVIVLQSVMLVAWIVMLWCVPQHLAIIRKLMAYGICVALLLYGGVATLGDWYEKTYPELSALKECQLHTGPDTSYVAFDTVIQDERVRVLATEKNWKKVKTHKTIGWLQDDCLSNKRVASNP